MTTIASQITSLMVVYLTVYSDADRRKHQSSASLAFVWGIHRDRWIPRTKGQLRGKCFHLMTSSCNIGYRNGLASNRTSHFLAQCLHYCDVTMGRIASQITSLTIVYSIVYSDADQRKHQSSASLAFVRGIHRGPVNSPHKWPVTRKMFPFDDAIMTHFTDAHIPYSKARWAHVGPTWSRRDPRWANVGPTTFAVGDVIPQIVRYAMGLNHVWST